MHGSFLRIKPVNVWSDNYLDKKRKIGKKMLYILLILCESLNRGEVGPRIRGNNNECVVEWVWLRVFLDALKGSFKIKF